MNAQTNDLRIELLSIINAYFQGDNSWAARALSSSGRSVSTRTLQSWLVDPRRISSRTCPRWAIKHLKEHVQSDAYKTAAALESRLKLDADIRPLSWANEVLSQQIVDLATSSIERDFECKERWQNASVADLPMMLAEFEIRTRTRQDRLDELISIVCTTIRASDDLKMKNTFDEQMRASQVVQHYRDDTRKAIENQTEEFSIAANESASPQPPSQGASNEI